MHASGELHDVLGNSQTLILSPQKISITNDIETQSNLAFEFYLKTRYSTNGEMDVHLLLSFASQSPAA
jgi:hypothetical protein